MGETWRGLLGQSLFNAVCPYPQANCTACPQLASCAYPQLFKPLDPTRLQPLWVHGWQRETPGWRVGLRWLGQQDHQLSPWLSALAKMESAAPFKAGPHFAGAAIRLRKASHPLTGETLWTPHDYWLAAPGRLPFADHLPETLLTTGCEVKFVTPLVSKHSGDPLFAALYTRLQRLIQHHGNAAALPRPSQPWQSRVLNKQPWQARLARRHLRGALWHLELSRIAPDALPLLAAGTQLHAGGQTACGCGQYNIVLPPT